MKISDLEHLEVISEATTIEGGLSILATFLAAANITSPFPIGDIVTDATGTGLGVVLPDGTTTGTSLSGGTASYIVG